MGIRCWLLGHKLNYINRVMGYHRIENSLALDQPLQLHERVLLIKNETEVIISITYCERCKYE